MKGIIVSRFCLLIAAAILLIIPGCVHTGAGKDPPSPSFPSAPEWGAHLAPEMVWVPGGTFRMGSDDSKDLDARPVHTVTVDGFYMSKNLVTQIQYHAVTGFNPSVFQGYLNQPRKYAEHYIRYELPAGMTSGDKLPVEQVTWFDTAEFCNKLSTLEGLTPVYGISNRKPAEGYPIESADLTVDWNADGYRMPTEAEWEFAARGESGMGPYFIYSGSNDPGAVAWYSGFSEIGDLYDAARTYPVGQKAPNGFGIYDLSGNVFEWCWDWFDEYPAGAQTNPTGPDSGSSRVKRGGAWSHLGADIVRACYRDMSYPSFKFFHGGIRLVRKGK